MSVNQQLNNIRIQAQAQLRLRAQAGDRVAQSLIHGFEGFENDPIGFSGLHLGAQFTDDIKRVMESVRDNQVTIAISANGVGKSFAAAHIAIWFYKSFSDSKIFLSSAPPEHNLKQILWGEISAIIRKAPHVFMDDKISEDMSIKRNRESFITGVVIPSSGSSEQREAKFSGKHAPHILFIADEGDAIPAEVYKGIDSCMSGGYARLLIMYNPRADRGYVANMVKNKKGNVIYLSAFDHPNVITGEDQIPGAVTQAKTIERINEWTVPLGDNEKPDIECFEVPPYLVGKSTIDKAGIPYLPLAAGWRKVRNPEFHYKVRGRYPPQSESQLISRADVDAAVSRWMSWVALYGEVPPPASIPVCALDVADLGSDSNVLSQKWGNWIPRLRIWTGVDPDAAAIKTADIIKGLGIDHKNVIVNVDSTGVGAGVAPRLKGLEIHNAKRVMVAAAPTFKVDSGEFFQLRDQLWWSTMLWLRKDPGAMLPPDQQLADELTTPTYWTGERDGKIRISTRESMVASLGRSPDRASSIVLLFAPTNTAWVRSAG